MSPRRRRDDIQQYRREILDGAELVALPETFEAARAALASGTLYQYAARHEAARPLAGRGVAYAVPLPNGERVVVRHNRHGGRLAPITRDLFLPPTRAPYELETALRLASLGVSTPAVVGYAIYPAGPLFRRSDVMTREVQDARDLSTYLLDTVDEERLVALQAAAALIGRLSSVGARHHDLNVKNVLIARPPGAAGLTALLLDVDRVEFGCADDSRIIEQNLGRFARSARKWRGRYGARVAESELADMAASVRRLVSSPDHSEPSPSTR